MDFHGRDQCLKQYSLLDSGIDLFFESGHLTARPPIDDDYVLNAFLADCDPGGVHSTVASADDAHPSFCQTLSVKIEALQKLHARVNAADVFPLQIQPLVLMRADGEKDGFETFLE